MTGRMCFSAESRLKTSRWPVGGTVRCSKRGPNVPPTMSGKFLPCVLHASAGEVRARGEERRGEERRGEERGWGWEGSRRSRRRRSWRVSTQCRPALLKHAARSSPYTTKTRAFVCQHWRNPTARKGQWVAQPLKSTPRAISGHN